MTDNANVFLAPKEINSEAEKQKLKASKKLNYDAQLQKEFSGIIDELNLSKLQKEFLRCRWLEQILWMESRARKARTRHFRLRLTSIIGGVILPGLLTLSVDRSKDESTSTLLYWGTFGLSQIVAISAATEQLFTYRERWIHYRRSAESLKTQGWQFFQLAGPYAPYKKNGDYQEAFDVFVTQVEEVVQRDVEIYTTQMMQKIEEKKSEQDPPDEKIDVVKQPHKPV